MRSVKTLLSLLCIATLLVSIQASLNINRLKNNNRGSPKENLKFNYQERFQVNTTAAGIPFYGQYFTGYIKVNTTTNSSLFYTLYSAGGNNATAQDSTLNSSNPLVLWLQGGPGCSGWLGNLMELGPMNIQYNTTSNTTQLSVNPYSWVTNNHLLFVDQPIGTGFSFGGDGETQDNTVASSVYLENFLIQFFNVYPELRGKPFYITGESYAGHYIPGLIARLVQNKKVNNINVTGIAIGDGLVAPQYQLVWDEFAYAAGLIDPNQRNTMRASELQSILYMKNRDWVNANNYMNDPQGQLETYTMGIDMDNFRNYPSGDGPEPMDVYLADPATRLALNIDPNVTFYDCSDSVGDLYSADIPQDYSINITYVLNTDPSVKVLIYTGADDIICNTIGQLRWVNSLNWANITKFKSSPKASWTLNNGTIAGTYRTYEQFTYAQVYKAGHMVPGDQPVSALKMLDNWFAGAWE